MSVEFVEPEPVAAPGPVEPGAGVQRGSAWPGRVLAGAAVVAAGLAVAGVQLTLYAVVRTAAIVDFDGTEYRVARIPVDAFGDSTPVALTSSRGVALSDYTASVSTSDGISYGPWWLGLAAVLVLAAVAAAVRPRATGPAAVVAAVGGVLLGSLGAAWLAARTVTETSVPQIRFTASPGVGLWLLAAAGGLALLAGLARALPRPRLARRHVQDPGPTTA